MKIVAFSIEEETDVVLGTPRKTGTVDIRIRLVSQSEDDMPPQGEARSLRAVRSWVATELLADE